MTAIHFVSDCPRIIHGYNFGNVLSPIPQISPYIGKNNGHVHITITLTWTILQNNRLELLANEYFKYKRKYPNIIVTILANEPKELDALRSKNIRSCLCSHNAFLDEHLYTINSEKQKKYDAVINSRMSPYKRIELARDIKNSCLITYFLDPSDQDYARTIVPYVTEDGRGVCKNMNFPQYQNGQWKWLSREDVNDIYAQSRCGVILSPYEGACFASAEYLLCGLPVVTTASIGGRDEFFDKDYVIYTDPDPKSVAEAVDKALALTISPEEIRNRTIEKMHAMRSNYCDMLNNIAKEEGMDINFHEKWGDFFINKMLNNYPGGLENELREALKNAGLRVSFPVIHRLHLYHKLFKEWLRKYKFKYKILR
ncbi:glycosyltransferase [uncultured Mailhella sp.]|uniref:glycosyltransferase n=1 Tax=uncultured Mailhella sp. TaxID=1981031 RepID=UPI00261645F4|nr:glycosyltransferase [uncultured Mailhella sp.]